MAIRVYKVAVVGCPRAFLSPDGFIDGVGKSCLCNRFVRSEAYNEEHQQDWSVLSQDEWDANPVFNGDHFVYWGAANKHLPDKTRVRFQVVEQSEFYCSPRSAHSSSSEEEESEEEEEGEGRKKEEVVDTRLKVHLSQEDYVSRASAVHFRSQKAGKMAYRLKAMDAAVRQSLGPVRAATQLFPNEEFGGKKSLGIYGFICVFDPTLEGDYMQRQLHFLSELLPNLVKTKRKVVIACVKCDAVEDHAIRFGSKLSSYALKKTVPFFEVSAREAVNVDDIFFSLVSAPKKSKNGSRGSFGSLGYREVVDSRKGDLNRAKDGFRKYLQLIVTEFTSTWSSTLPLLKMDRSFQSVQLLAGKEADTILLKLFQLRLIEIKLKEAGQEYGNSLVKKADKEKSKQYQVYLKEAFSEHPDLRDDSTYREYLPSISDEMDTILTEPSTPSSTCQTPELMDVTARVTRLRSATLSDLPEMDDVQEKQLLNKSVDDLSSSQQSKKGKWKKHFSFASSSIDKTPPPLPSRDTGQAANPPRSAREGSGSDSLASSGAKRLSSSTDCLFSPEDNQQLNRPGHGVSFDRLDAAPYLQPREVKIVLKKSSDAKQPEPSKRNTAGFLSLRSPKRGTKLKTVVSKDNVLNRPENGSSLERKTHKRTRSNPFILDGMNVKAGQTPPELPPRNLDTSITPSSTHTTPNHTSARHDSTMAIMESSLEFASPSSADAWRTSDKPHMSLPPLPDDGESPLVPRMKLQTSEEDDNISQSSGPFEEIESSESRTNFSPPLPAGRGAGILRSTTMGRVVPEDRRGSELMRRATLGRLGSGTKTSHSNSDNNSDNNDADDDQYAEIEDFQQYMQMASVPVDKSKTLPSFHSGVQLQQEEGADGPLTPVKKPHNKSMSAMSQVQRTSTMKKELLRKKLKKSQRTEQSLDSKDGQSPPTPPPHKSGVSPSPKQPVDNRPLPPSPSKGVVTRTISSGSNIYESIDEEFIHRVRNRPSRHSSQRKAIADWLPAVDRSLLPKYMEVVKTFFSLPQIQEQWYEVVKSVMEDVDPTDILPPYSKLCSNEHFGQFTEEEALKEEDEPSEERDITSSKPHSSAPPATATKDEGSSASQSLRTTKPAAAMEISPALDRLLRVGSGARDSPRTVKNSPPMSDRGEVPTGSSLMPSTGKSLKASSGSNELILMLNRYESDYTSETDSDEDDDLLDSDSSDLDLDLDVPLFIDHTSPEALLEKQTQGAREALLSQTSADIPADDFTTPIAMDIAPSPSPEEPPSEPKQTQRGSYSALSPDASRTSPVTTPLLGHAHHHSNPLQVAKESPSPQCPNRASQERPPSPVVSHISPAPSTNDRTSFPLRKAPPSPLLKHISPASSPLLGRSSPAEHQQTQSVKERAPSPLLSHISLDRLPDRRAEGAIIRQTSPDLFADAWSQDVDTDIDLPSHTPSEPVDERYKENAPSSPLQSRTPNIPIPDPPSTKEDTFSGHKSPHRAPGVEETEQAVKSTTHFFSSSSPELPLPKEKPSPIHRHPPRGKSQPPAVKPKPRRISVPQTDLDTALELRASVSNDSGSTDSALTKSPYSNAEFDLGGSESEDTDQGVRNMGPGGNLGEGRSARLGSGEVEVVHNVKPSQFLKSKSRARYLLQSRDGSVSEDSCRSRTDSGTFEDQTTPTFY